MKRSYYFWVAAILALLFGLLMLFVPGQAASAFQLGTSNGSTNTIFRVLGSVMLGVALLNFLVRNHTMSETLRAVLWTNVAIHGIGFLADLWSVQQGDVPFSGVAIGLVAHLIVLLGGAYYLWRPAAR
jgi:hypothetical protein